ncbi:MAG: hypothetical protein LBD80_06290 [Tannerella sp.]|nr:hypothetical protein [Tannerella sp.]
MRADNERMLSGEEPAAHSVHEVRDVPEKFKKWVRGNADRIAKAEENGTLPYFVRDNRGVVDSSLRSADIFNSTCPTMNITSHKPTQLPISSVLAGLIFRFWKV